MSELGRPNPTVAAGVILWLGFKEAFSHTPCCVQQKPRVSLGLLWPLSPSLMWLRLFGGLRTQEMAYGTQNLLAISWGTRRWVLWTFPLLPSSLSFQERTYFLKSVYRHIKVLYRAIYIGRNTIFIVLCNLSPKSCFLFLSWGGYSVLSSYFTIPVCFLLFFWTSLVFQ